jgi:1-deoxy-D-xylulose-5-phosphate reductoisomerase
MNQAQCITILGSTGSIGTSTLDVLSRHPGQYRIHALTASSQVDLMLSQCARFTPEVAVMAQDAG